MNRISKALEKLRGKCTSAGTPRGSGVADILDCIADNYEGGSGGVSVAFATYNDEKSTEDYSYFDVYGKANGDELFLVVGDISPVTDEFKADKVYTRSSNDTFVCFDTSLLNAITVMTASEDDDEETDEIVGYKSWSKDIVSAE